MIGAVKAPAVPLVLRPYEPAEAINVATAARIAGRSAQTIRNWSTEFYIGRKVGPGRVMISHPALLMWLDDNRGALERYLSGSRDGEVAQYFRRALEAS